MKLNIPKDLGLRLMYLMAITAFSIAGFQYYNTRPQMVVASFLNACLNGKDSTAFIESDLSFHCKNNIASYKITHGPRYSGTVSEARRREFDEATDVMTLVTINNESMEHTFSFRVKNCKIVKIFEWH